MGLLGNILVTFALGFWPMTWAVSVMGMGGPGASNSLNWIIQLLVFMSYPAWLLLWLSISGKSYWGADPRYFLLGFLFLYSVLNAELLKYGFNLIRGINNEGYSVADGSVFYDAKVIKEADASTFRVVPGELALLYKDYASDDYHSYFKGKTVTGAPGGELEPLDGDWSGWYMAVADKVIWEENLLPNCTALSFQTFDGHTAYWARCNENIYFSGRLIEGADAKSFLPLSSNLAVDKNHLYSGSDVLDTSADIKTFRQIDGLYYRDGNSVYIVSTYDLTRVEGADPETFEVIYDITDHIRSDARDAHSRYYNGEKVAPR